MTIYPAELMGDNFMIDNANSAIIIFAKQPVTGKVKTRLAAEMGNDFAVEFYKKCAAHIFDEVSELHNFGIDCYLFYGVDDDIAEVKTWVDKNFIFCPQVDGDLGHKMSCAFQKVFEDKISKAIIVGTDVPDINAEILLNAFTDLEQIDIVISPSHDGGYNFLGMNNFYPELFQNIKWSTGEVFQKTIFKTSELGLIIKITECLFDIDEKPDLMNWVSDLNKGNIKLKNIIADLIK